MSDFKMNGSNMITIQTNLKNIKTDLEDSYQMLSDLIDAVASDGIWTGNEVKAFQGYMDLMKQYHGDFTEAGNTDNCVDQAIEAFSNLSSEDSCYYIDFDEFQKIKEIN